jgi:predicted N-acyltransferase
MSTLLENVGQALAWHKERHSPSGFGFAISDGIDYLDGAAWDALTATSSFFMKRPYLRALEKAGPENLKPRHAILFKGKTPVAALAMQAVSVAGSSVAAAGKTPAKNLRAKVVVCGNLLSWGQHAVAFAPGVDPAEVWPGVAEALYRVRRAEKLSGRTDLVMVKDVPDAEALKRFSYGSIETDPDMVLEFPSSWKTFDDYLASLHSKYRKNAVRVTRDLEAAGCTLEPLTDVAGNAERLHSLYLQVNQAAAVRPVTLPAGYFPALAEAAAENFRSTVIRKDGEILGFSTTIKDGETAVGYYLGYDRSKKEELPLYFALLQANITDAISLGCRRISMGRTALEPKAKLGAKPVPMRIWARHSHPLVNVLVKGLMGAVPHDEAPERDPFKDAPALTSGAEK